MGVVRDTLLTNGKQKGSHTHLRSTPLSPAQLHRETKQRGGGRQRLPREEEKAAIKGLGLPEDLEQKLWLEGRKCCGCEKILYGTPPWDGWTAEMLCRLIVKLELLYCAACGVLKNAAVEDPPSGAGNKGGGASERGTSSFYNTQHASNNNNSHNNSHNMQGGMMMEGMGIISVDGVPSTEVKVKRGRGRPRLPKPDQKQPRQPRKRGGRGGKKDGNEGMPMFYW